MTNTVTALRIPVDGRDTRLVDMPTSESGSCLESLREQLQCSLVEPVSLEYHSAEHGITHLDFWFDEEGFFVEDPICNLEAMHVMDAVLEDGARLHQPYIGNCVVTSYDPETGATVSVPDHAIKALEALVSKFSPMDAYFRVYAPMMRA